MAKSDRKKDEPPPPPTGTLWEVVGPSDLVVRTGRDLVSPKVASKLSIGALVRQKELVAQRLSFALVAGLGPESGWVSVKSAATGKAVLRPSEKEPPSAEASAIAVDPGGTLPPPLSPGITDSMAKPAESAALALPQAVAATADKRPARNESRLPETAPLTKDESCPTDADHPDASVESAHKGKASSAGLDGVEPHLVLRPRIDLEPVAGRRMRILGLHGAPGNGNLVKFQSAQLRKALGDDVDWLFLDAPRPWHPEPRETMDKWEHVTRERTDFELRIADGKEFTQWYDMDLAGDVAEPPILHVREGCEYILEYIEKEGPIDVIVAFSNGSSITFALLLLLQKRGLKAPWRLNVFFCGSPPPIEDGMDAIAPLDQPTVEILGGDGDNWAPLASGFAKNCCTNAVIVEHVDGHQWPLTEPRATEIYAWIAAEVRRHCGLQEPGDELLRRPPVPREVEVTVRHALEEQQSEVIVRVMENCTVLDVKEAVMKLIQATKPTEVRIVKKAGLSFTALANEEPISGRREFLSIGRTLEVPDARGDALGETPKAVSVSQSTETEKSLKGKGATEEQPAGNPRWRVVGGASVGGIRVRDSDEWSALELPKRLSTGAIVEEIQRGGEDDEKIRYVRISGDGPKIGWVTIALPNGKVLLERVLESS